MATRDEFVKGLKTRLDAMNLRIEKIEKRVPAVKEESKVKLQARIQNLREKRDSAFAKIQEVKNTSGEAWHDLTQSAKSIINVLKVALSKTMAGFKKV